MIRMHEINKWLDEADKITEDIMVNIKLYL